MDVLRVDGRGGREDDLFAAFEQDAGDTQHLRNVEILRNERSVAEQLADVPFARIEMHNVGFVDPRGAVEHLTENVGNES